MPTPRALDHLVLPVASTKAARKRLNEMGFTVAPTAAHPFGTENACVFFKEGAYLEPLAVAQREKCEEAVRQANPFVTHDWAWRFRNGQNGFSAAAFEANDAEEDHRSFRENGISGGEMLRFERVFQDQKGNASKGSFALAFASDPRSPDFLAFVCERVNSPRINRDSLETHPNGVVRILEVTLSEPNPTDFQYFLQDVIGQREVLAHSFGIEIQAANVNFTVRTPSGIRTRFGIEAPSRRGLTGCAVTFEAPNLSLLREMLDANRIRWSEIAGRIVVSPAEGQGVAFAFESPENNA